MIGLAPECRLDVDRGPDWLFVRVHPPEHDPLNPLALAEQVWRVAAQHFTYRVVLELDGIAVLHSYLIGQLVLLSERIHQTGGVLRLCGLSDHNQMVMQTCRLDDGLPNFSNRADAVMGNRPRKPR